MKYILIFTFLVFNLLAEDKKHEISIGMGPYFQTQPYKEVDTILVPSPVVFFEGDIFYVRWTRVGAYFLGEKKEDYAWGFSLTMQPRPYGYVSSDSIYLNSMDDRKSSFEGGVAFSASHKDTFLEIMLLTDVLARYDSWILKAEIGDKYKLKNFTFYPALGITYESKKFLDYYYGVKSSESTPTRVYYKANDGIQLSAQTYISYPITDELSAFINLKADYLPKSATESPIVEYDYIYSGLVSLIYTFKY
jgi:outer membrane protein